MKMVKIPPRLSTCLRWMNSASFLGLSRNAISTSLRQKSKQPPPKKQVEIKGDTGMGDADANGDSKMEEVE